MEKKDRRIINGKGEVGVKYYMVDAFTNEHFKGNPAGVCVLETMLPAEQMQQIAAEHNLSETAFLLKAKEGYQLRWFTPGFEIDLCGHATLASAFVVFQYLEPGLAEVVFHTMSGALTVIRKGNLYEMSFPQRLPEKINITPEAIAIFGSNSVELYSDRDLYVVMESERQVRGYVPDYNELKCFKDWLGVVITAKGEDTDFVSRYFCPELTLEDPVTGSTHSTLIPMWSGRLKKDKLVAKQLSARGGTLYCEMGETDVKISGEAVLYMSGEIMVS